ncbi:phage tail tape measure protein [Mesorhizobium sp. KR2-14]|uniref:phage tail tape measure protein n=1 Tax=Mesorhizobium sp. KR2-14 TaxID=3156610 RepID=UPI0032B5F0AE
MIAVGSQKMQAAMLRYAAPAAVLAGAGVSIKAYAEIERRMERIGITADASADETKAALERVRQIADDIRAPVEQVVDGLDSLTASGKTMKEALALLSPVSRTAQAADANFGEMATTADAIANSFGIAADKMERAFDIVAKGGKEGKFELKDMASELPSLAPAFTALGYKGEAGLARLVAYLQTVRMETGMSSEAATSFMDVLTKMESTNVVNHFKEFGIDVRRGLAQARRSGQDPLEAFFAMTRAAIKGDMSKLPQLFTDKQMLIGVRAILRNTEALKQYETAMSDAAGTVERDLARIVNTTESKLDRLGNSWRQLKESIGGGLVDMGAGDLMDGASQQMSKAQAINKALDDQGMSWLEKRMWWLKNAHLGADPAGQDAMAWRGGYRTEDERRAIAAYAEYGASRNAATAQSRIAPRLPRDKTGLPITGPIPPARAAGGDGFSEAYAAQKRTADMAEQYALAGNRYRRYGAPRTISETSANWAQHEAESMADYRKNYRQIENEVTLALDSLAKDVGTTIVDSGRPAGQSLGDTAAVALSMQADSIGARIGTSFGLAAKSLLNGLLSDLARPVGSLPRRGVNADLGRAGGDVQASGGP